MDTGFACNGEGGWTKDRSFLLNRVYRSVRDRARRDGSTDWKRNTATTFVAEGERRPQIGCASSRLPPSNAKASVAATAAAFFGAVMVRRRGAGAVGCSTGGRRWRVGAAVGAFALLCAGLLGKPVEADDNNHKVGGQGSTGVQQEVATPLPAGYYSW